jgi:hypothetical protein
MSAEVGLALSLGKAIWRCQLEYAVKLANNAAAAIVSIKLEGNPSKGSLRLRQSTASPQPANSIATRNGITQAVSVLDAAKHWNPARSKPPLPTTVFRNTDLLFVNRHA